MNQFLEIKDVVELRCLDAGSPHFRIVTGKGNEFDLRSEKNCYASAKFGAELVEFRGNWGWCMNRSLVATMAKLFWDAQKKKISVRELLGNGGSIPLIEEKAAVKYLAKIDSKRYPGEPFSQLKNAQWYDEDCKGIPQPEWIGQWIEKRRLRLSVEIIDHLAAVDKLVKNGFCAQCQPFTCMGCCLEDVNGEMVGGLVKRAISLMEHMPHRGREDVIRECKEYVDSHRKQWYGQPAEIEVRQGSVMDVACKEATGLAVFLPSGLTAFRWDAKDFMKKYGRMINKADGLEYFECGQKETKALSRMVYCPNKSNEIYTKQEIETYIEAAFEFFENAGVTIVAMNGFKTAGDGASDTYSAVKYWASRHTHSCVEKILLVDKRGDFNRVKKQTPAKTCCN